MMRRRGPKPLPIIEQARFDIIPGDQAAQLCATIDTSTSVPCRTAAASRCTANPRAASTLSFRQSYAATTKVWSASEKPQVIRSSINAWYWVVMENLRMQSVATKSSRMRSCIFPYGSHKLERGPGQMISSSRRSTEPIMPGTRMATLVIVLVPERPDKFHKCECRVSIFRLYEIQALRIDFRIQNLVGKARSTGVIVKNASSISMKPQLGPSHCNQQLRYDDLQ